MQSSLGNRLPAPSEMDELGSDIPIVVGKLVSFPPVGSVRDAPGEKTEVVWVHVLGRF